MRRFIIALVVLPLWGQRPASGGPVKRAALPESNPINAEAKIIPRPNTLLNFDAYSINPALLDPLGKVDIQPYLKDLADVTQTESVIANDEQLMPESIVQNGEEPN